jgi:hypothetical protein
MSGIRSTCLNDGSSNQSKSTEFNELLEAFLTEFRSDQGAAEACKIELTRHWR